MSEAVLIALVAALGGAGGIATMLKAWADHRNNLHAREDDADERLVTRLERRLDGAEKEIRTLHLQREADALYIAQLAWALANAGIPIPPRTTPFTKE